MQYSYLGVTFYKQPDIKQLIADAYHNLNVLGCILIFPIVVIHEYLHYILAKIMKFYPEVRMLKDGEYPAYCRFMISDTDNKTKITAIPITIKAVTIMNITRSSYLLISNAVQSFRYFIVYRIRLVL